MSRTTLCRTDFFALLKWLEVEHKSKRLDGLDTETISVRAQKDLGLALTRKHIRDAAKIANIVWASPRASHPGNSTTTAAVGKDLRELSSILVQLMDELGIEKTRAHYQLARKLALLGGTREVNPG